MSNSVRNYEKEYFDVDFNTWSLIKFNESINEAKKVFEGLG